MFGLNVAMISTVCNIVIVQRNAISSPSSIHNPQSTVLQQHGTWKSSWLAHKLNPPSLYKRYLPSKPYWDIPIASRKTWEYMNLNEQVQQSTNSVQSLPKNLIVFLLIFSFDFSYTPSTLVPASPMSPGHMPPARGELAMAPFIAPPQRATSTMVDSAALAQNPFVGAIHEPNILELPAKTNPSVIKM